jgi:energy-coupling factor transporter ATP-binding protein EcfA2
MKRTLRKAGTGPRKPSTSPRKSGAGTRSPDASGHIAAVTVKDFKSLKDVTVELGQINVFIGANGAGKSCLLEAIGILGACAAGAVDDQALLRRGVRPGVPELYKSSFGREKIAPKISLRAVSTRGAEYHAYITNPTKPPEPYWVFGNESLEFGGHPIASRGPTGNASALGISAPLENNRSVTTLVRASQETDANVRTFLSWLDGFGIFAPVTPVLRSIAPDTAPRSPVGLYGGGLAEAVGLLATQKAGKVAIERALSLIEWAAVVRAGEPSRSFLSPSVQTSRYVVEFQDRFMAKRRNVLSGYDASEGALYILFMLVLATHGQSPAIFAVDNFDQALNPRTARSLTRMFVESVLNRGLAGSHRAYPRTARPRARLRRAQEEAR